MLWRGPDVDDLPGFSSLEKLRQVWRVKPYDDIDCRLTTLQLKSYCVQADAVTFNVNLSLTSDIPKVIGNHNVWKRVNTSIVGKNPLSP